MKVRKGSVSYYILTAMEKGVDGLVRLEDFTYNSYKYMQGAPNLKKSALSQAIRRLRDGGLIERNLDQGKIVLKLTSLGHDYLAKDEPWDGKYRIVIWDIPENKRIVRDLFRRRLKDWGFKQWQNSVWITKKNITKKLRSLINDLNIDEWVAIVESDDPSLVHVKFNGRGR